MDPNVMPRKLFMSCGAIAIFLRPRWKVEQWQLRRMSNWQIHGTGIPLRAPVGLVGTTHVVHGSNMNLPQKATDRKMQQTCQDRSANAIEGFLLLQMGVCVWIAVHLETHM